MQKPSLEKIAPRRSNIAWAVGENVPNTSTLQHHSWTPDNDTLCLFRPCLSGLSVCLSGWPAGGLAGRLSVCMSLCLCFCLSV